MNSMFDFITHVKGIEYILSLTFIAGYVLFWEVLKPKPFKKVKETARKTWRMSRERHEEQPETGRQDRRCTFVGLLYVILLPAGLVSALSYALVSRVAGKNTSFSWRPAEAYLSGKKKTKKQEPVDDRQSQQK
jgi:hypothetical protein